MSALLPSELEQVVAELSAGVIGAVVQKVSLPSPRVCYLEVRKVGQSVLLCLSAEVHGARLSVAQGRPAAPLRALAFQQRLRKLLIGTKLASFSMLESGWGVALGFVGAAGAEPSWWLEGRWTGERQGLRLVREAPPPSPVIDISSRPPRFTPVASAAFPWAAAAELWGEALSRDASSELQTRREHALRRTACKRLERTIEKVRAEAQRGAAAEQHRRFGELLSRHTEPVVRGAREVRAVEYGEEGPRPVMIPIHPGRSPRDEAEWNFRQYRRFRRGVELATARLRALERQLVELEQAETKSVGPTSSGTRSPRPEGATGLPYRTYAASNGGTIWVGRGGAANDALTFRVARPNDIWLHARGVPGAHVVISWGRSEEPPPELLLDAAHLAAHYSKLKGEPRVEVSHTRVKEVKRVKGGRPGSVTYTGERTLLLRIQPERLARLLGTQPVESDDRRR